MSYNKVSLARIPALDGVRAIAILFVLVWHYYTGLISPDLLGGFAGTLRSISGLAWSGVDLFFVLSGFLIGRILIWNKFSDHYFSTFYARRALRIFPPYLLVVALFFLCAATIQSEHFFWLFADSVSWWSYVGYVQNFFMLDGFGANWLGVTWSLAVEEQFYLIFPVLIYLIPARLIPWLCGVMILFAVTFRLAMQDQAAYAGYVLLPARVDALCLGALLAWFSLNSSDDSMRRNGRMVTIALAAGGVGILLLAKLLFHERLGGPALHLGLALAAAALVLQAVLAPQGSWLARLLGNPVCSWLAGISYMLYLIHQPVLGLLHGALLKQAPAINNTTDAVVTLLSLGVALAISTASLHWFERPVLRYAKRFTYQSPRHQAIVEPDGVVRNG